jgi:hypothetical protein
VGARTVNPSVKDVPMRAAKSQTGCERIRMGLEWVAVIGVLSLLAALFWRSSSPVFVRVKRKPRIKGFRGNG